MLSQSKENAVFVVGYTISDAAGDYRAVPDYPTWREAVAHCDRDAGEAVGATICNEAEAVRGIPKLLAVPVGVRFLSAESHQCSDDTEPLKVWGRKGLALTCGLCGSVLAEG